MARAELIEAQRQALLLEMQHIRKDILQQEAWLRVRISPPLPPPPTPLDPCFYSTIVAYAPLAPAHVLPLHKLESVTGGLLDNFTACLLAVL